jgi:hypothetical protein
MRGELARVFSDASDDAEWTAQKQEELYALNFISVDISSPWSSGTRRRGICNFLSACREKEGERKKRSPTAIRSDGGAGTRWKTDNLYPQVLPLPSDCRAWTGAPSTGRRGRPCTRRPVGYLFWSCS